MKNLLILLVLLLSGCASFQVSTMNHDPIYSIEGSDAEITVINNEFELQRLLRDDFNFRYDFAQYAMSQPMSFNWRFNRFNFYYSYWDRYQMWNDWVWNYPYGNGIGWSYSWGNNSWSSNNWNNPYGWNNYYGWNNGYLRDNVAYHSSRRVNNQRTVLPQTTNRETLPQGRRVIRNTNNFNTRGEIVRVNPPPRLNRVTLNQPQTTRKINSKNKN
jgi:hypothetical protein